MDKHRMRIGQDVTWYKCQGGTVKEMIEARIESFGKGDKVLVSFQPDREEERKARWVASENIEPRDEENGWKSLS